MPGRPGPLACSAGLSALVSLVGYFLVDRILPFPQQIGLDSAEAGSLAVRPLGRLKLNELFGILRMRNHVTFFPIESCRLNDLF